MEGSVRAYQLDPAQSRRSRCRQCSHCLARRLQYLWALVFHCVSHHFVALDHHRALPKWLSQLDVFTISVCMVLLTASRSARMHSSERLCNRGLGAFFGPNLVEVGVYHTPGQEAPGRDGVEAVAPWESQAIDEDWAGEDGGHDGISQRNSGLHGDSEELLTEVYGTLKGK